MRIVGGSERGRKLAVPKGATSIRPTADRVRQSLFNVIGQTCEGLHVLDLFAGTGALALEAVSRGATLALLIDSGREAQALCRANLTALGYADRVELWPTTVEKAVDKLGRDARQFDLVFADPPYALEAGRWLVDAVGKARLVRAGGLFCFEHSKHEVPPSQAPGLAQTDARAFGETRMTFYATT